MNDKEKIKLLADMAADLYEALHGVTGVLARDPRTKSDDELWGLFSQCVAALHKASRVTESVA